MKPNELLKACLILCESHQAVKIVQQGREASKQKQPVSRHAGRQSHGCQSQMIRPMLDWAATHQQLQAKFYQAVS
jgi:hypothetical protein